MYISPTRAISLYEAFGSMKIWTALFYVYENIQFISSEKHDVVSHPPNAMAVLYEQWSCNLNENTGYMVPVISDSEKYRQTRLTKKNLN